MVDDAPNDRVVIRSKITGNEMELHQSGELITESIDNDGIIETQDLVVNGTATGVAQDLQGCRVFLNSDQSINSATHAKIEFDGKVYDSGSNFDTANHEFTCPKAGLYIAQVSIRFLGGGDGEERRAIIGNQSSHSVDGKGVFIKRVMDSRRHLQAMTVNQYSSGDKIVGYARNDNSSDVLLSGSENFSTFMEVAFLGSL
jgi:hypothetical protein